MTPPHITLQAVSPADAAFLLSVYASTREPELARTDWSDEQKFQFCHMQFQAQDAHYRLHYPKAQWDVIRAEDVPVGRLYVDRWPREIRIMDITLVPEHRGKGIGTHLLQELQAEAAAAGKSLSIHVERDNPALHLYARLGFQVIEDKGLHLLMAWHHTLPSNIHSGTAANSESLIGSGL
jgi:ribosomal protein S18 acetylase RimI-like enzyme